ncbi:hypothetical protein OPT61_g1617 [Boeremia exigua]|uniref:Uncharacterized protein n=1 Tax=Boeremia exigua TaxID=749465 RepID=A0ACC2IPE3_9PLEO|nr:hypothetical protein OPT61_g1617 [Boeremia exigua]
MSTTTLDTAMETTEQSISGRWIDSAKLTTLLRVKFGAGSFNVHLIQDSYYISAPQRLSAVHMDEWRTFSAPWPVGCLVALLLYCTTPDRLILDFISTVTPAMSVIARHLP